MTNTAKFPTADASQTTETDDVIARLRWLDNANVGRTASDDEAISGVCESGIEELERLREKIQDMEGEAHDAAMEWREQMERSE